jgi:predicted small metal-binding protein
MAKAIACADMGMADCPGSFKVETEEELFEHVGLHAQRAHPQLEMTPELIEQAKGLVKTS